LRYSAGRQNENDEKRARAKHACVQWSITT
jgi:hypothetical protein